MSSNSLSLWCEQHPINNDNRIQLVAEYIFLSRQVPAIPRIFYFALSNILVLLVLADSAYIAHLLQQGNLKHSWPVRLLRILVAGNPNMRFYDLNL